MIRSARGAPQVFLCIAVSSRASGVNPLRSHIHRRQLSLVLSGAEPCRGFTGGLANGAIDSFLLFCSRDRTDIVCFISEHTSIAHCGTRMRG